jgi:hypothetical protein
MVITVVTGHEVSVTSIARRRVVLLRAIGPNTPVSVVALLGTRYFITVVTSTHISGLTVFLTRMRPQSFKRQSSWPAPGLPWVGGRPAGTHEIQRRSKIKRACKWCVQRYSFVSTMQGPYREGGGLSGERADTITVLVPLDGFLFPPRHPSLFPTVPIHPPSSFDTRQCPPQTLTPATRPRSCWLAPN